MVSPSISLSRDRLLLLKVSNSFFKLAMEVKEDSSCRSSHSRSVELKGDLSHHARRLWWFLAGAPWTSSTSKLIYR
jgi:hypothetical protein